MTVYKINIGTLCREYKVYERKYLIFFREIKNMDEQQNIINLLVELCGTKIIKEIEDKNLLGD